MVEMPFFNVNTNVLTFWGYCINKNRWC